MVNIKSCLMFIFQTIKTNQVMKKLNLILLSLTLIGAVTFTSCEKDPDEEPKIIIDLAVDNGFNVLAAALTEAGLIDDLEGTGPFTVFAPTDEAFNSAGITVDNIASVAGLDEILLYHVVSGEILSTDLSSGDVETLAGKYTSIDASAIPLYFPIDG